ncbi:hypothetical protein CR513_11521, partial [Mucuna pruriens]
MRLIIHVLGVSLVNVWLSILMIFLFILHVVFLGFVDCPHGIKVDEEKVNVIQIQEGGLIGHFGEHTYETLHEHFYWPLVSKDVHHIYERCLVCKMESLGSHPMDCSLHFLFLPHLR